MTGCGLYTSVLCIFIWLYRVYILYFTAKTHIPIWNVFYQNPIKYCNMAIYCNTLKHNMQYSIDPYCFIPSSCNSAWLHNLCAFLLMWSKWHCWVLHRLQEQTNTVERINLPLKLITLSKESALNAKQSISLRMWWNTLTKKWRRKVRAIQMFMKEYI